MYHLQNTLWTITEGTDSFCRSLNQEEVKNFSLSNTLHRIEANVMTKNKASLRVLEKNHFENEGLSKYYLNINGIWQGHTHMVRINYCMQ